MAAGGSASFCFLIVCFLVCSSEAQKIITAELGQEVILPCKVPDNININNIRAVEWSRPGHDPEYVLFYRDGRFDPDNQHPSYQNRVDLQDKDMKNGNFSLILKNVTMNDSGTYECRVFEIGNKDPINIVNLRVLLPDQKIIGAEKITADLGQEVILPCKASKKNNNITAVEWIRPDLDPGYVLFYQDGHFDTINQHQSYQNRVDLQDEDMKDGDVSLILKNVTKNDTGTYECWVYQRNKFEPITIINLEVLPPGNQLGIGAIILIVLAVLAVLAGISGLIYKKCWKKNRNLSGSPDESTAVPMLSVSSSAAQQTTTSETLMEPADKEQSENVN